MADLNALIAQGAQFRQPESQLNMMAQMQQLQQGQSANQLNQMNIAEKQRAQEEQIALRSLYAGSAGQMESPEFLAKLAARSPTAYQAQLKFLSEQAESKAKLELTAAQTGAATAATAESKQKLLKANKDYVNQSLSELSFNLSPENIKAFGQDAVLKGLMTQEQSNAKVQELLAMPVPELKQYLATRGLSNKDTADLFQSKPLEQTDGQTKWMVENNPRLPNYGQRMTGAKPITMLPTPGEQLTAGTAAAGQKLTADTAAKRLAFDQTKFNWEKANPGFDLIQDAEGGYLAVNKKNPRDITPLMMAAPPVAGAAPAAPTVPGARGAINVTDGGRPPMVPVKGKPAQMPAKFTETDMQLSGLAGSLKEFKDEVKKDLGTTAKWLPSGSDTARMNAKYTALLMGVKDLYTLGALTGPDMSIIESQLTNPASWSGKFTSKKGFDEQVQVIENMLKRSAKNLENTYGRAPKATQEALKSTLNEVSDTNPLGIPGR